MQNCLIDNSRYPVKVGKSLLEYLKELLQSWNEEVGRQRTDRNEHELCRIGSFLEFRMG